MGTGDIRNWAPAPRETVGVCRRTPHRALSMMSSTADRTGWMVATDPNDVFGEALLRRGGPRDSAGYRLFKRENPQGLWTSMSARQRAAWIERADDETTVNDQPVTA